MSGTVKNLRIHAWFRDGSRPHKVVGTVLKNGKPCGVSFAARMKSSTRRDPVELSTNAAVCIEDDDELSVSWDITPQPKDLAEYREIIGGCGVTFLPDTKR